MIIKKTNFDNININIEPWNKIFLYWDLWSWKTTLTQYFLRKFFGIEEKIKSPTYIHYKKYWENIYHFDLYRLENYDEFVNIGWEEILDNDKNTCFIEWPEIIEKYYNPNYKLKLKKIDEDSRDLEF